MKNSSSSPQSDNIVITIGRQFGSGGRALGRMIADRLGIPYYDKELLSRAAANAGVAETFVEENDERMPSFLSSVLSFNMGLSASSWYQGPTSISGDRIYASQSDVIQMLASQGSCVIVGRTADYILRDHPRLVNVFVYAPIESCVDRIVERTPSLSRAKARSLAEKTNKLRSAYYNFYTDRRWGHPSSYHLMFDTSLLPLEDIADIIAEYARRRFATHNKKS